MTVREVSVYVKVERTRVVRGGNVRERVPPALELEYLVVVGVGVVTWYW